MQHTDTLNSHHSESIVIPGISFEWVELETFKGGARHFIQPDHDIWAVFSNPKQATNPLLKITLAKGSLIQLDVCPEAGDKVNILQAKNDPHNFLLIKSINGYKLRPSVRKGCYDIHCTVRNSGMNLFGYQKVQSYLRANGTIQLVFPKGE